MTDWNPTPGVDPHSTTNKQGDIAVLHGNYFARGGGERVADRIAGTFDAPLYYGFGDESVQPDDGIVRKKLFDPNPISKRLVRRIHQYRDLLFMWNGMHRPELFDYNVVIQSGNEFGWYVPKEMQQTIVKYVHSPPRGPYDMHHKHGDSPLHRAYSLAAKTLYGHTTDYVDVYVANSEVVAERCRKAWGVEPEIVYPPVAVEEYGPEHATQNTNGPTYLTFSRLYRHKRTREIVQAFKQLDGQLIVGGDGPQREHLESIAPANVTVKGYLSESEKRRLLASVDGFIFNAQNEDFGIVPVEAMASGTPVLGINDGFTKHQIRDGVNGMLFEDGTPEDIRHAVARFETNGIGWDADALQRFAEQFSVDAFETGMRDAVALAKERTNVDTQLDFEV